jgi:hypothetical protein
MQPIAASITLAGIDDGDKICWGSTPNALPGTLPGTRTLPGLDPDVGFQAIILVPPPPITTDTATITTTDPEPPRQLGDNSSSITLSIPATPDPSNNPFKPTAIRLLSFELVSGDGQVMITWATGAEIDNEGFNILRSSSPNGPFVKVNPVLIPARAISPAGANYSFVDSSVEDGKTYYYRLEDIDNRGIRSAHNIAAVTPVFAGAPPASDTSKASSRPQAPLGAIESTSASIPSQHTFFFQILEYSGNTLEVPRQEIQQQDESASKGEDVSSPFSFKAISSDRQITLEWTTSDLEERFNILRSETEEREYVQIDGAKISVSEEISGIARYSYIDANVVNNTTYYYKLEQTTKEGKSTFIGPIPATPQLALSQAQPEQKQGERRDTPQ